MSQKRTAPPRLMGKVTMVTIPHFSPLTSHLPLHLLLSGHEEKKKNKLTQTINYEPDPSANLFESCLSNDNPFTIKATYVRYCPLDGAVPFKMLLKLLNHHNMQLLSWSEWLLMCAMETWSTSQ